MKFNIILSALVFFGLNAQASTFENVRGTYKILNCKNESANPSVGDAKLCNNKQVTIHPETYGTSIYFSQWVNGEEAVRSFGLPKNMSQLPHGKYSEKGDYYASFINDQYGYGEVIIMRKVSGDLYHLSMHRRSDTLKTLDIFEMDLERTSRTSEPLPAIPEIEDGGDPCGLPEYDLKASPASCDDQDRHGGKYKNIK
ncbi:hypothetical protein [Bdellovibrio bacteriovorus]|uniref:Uncharacterized protein n=1 Tax=Bdellovibrio bacteriovorus TaxID=959 RepID=A0A150WTF8_BDEBC|nr:hypothetical protein [Bdellovibrio bacteriovorus]KYG69779.1 hypothetical protein AZI85_16125 [Bdellovibrio bacteriovorus]